MVRMTIFFVTVMLCMSMISISARSGPERKAETYDARMQDWRNHQVVYQVFVDRFFASSDPKQRAQLYSAPRRLRAWHDQPSEGPYVPAASAYQHEIDFWGGDLKGVTAKLDYIKSLGANVLYLNPIFLAYTNHKYDTTDYFAIDPQYGTLADFEELCQQAHQRGLRVVLDGVFNHTGKTSIWFQDALKNNNSPYRNFYTFGNDLKNGYVGWYNVANLPELNYHNPIVRKRIYLDKDSVVQKYLQYADGWRLDVAFDLGPEVLNELTESAHRQRSDAYVVGEIYNYPPQWFPALDGVMNIFLKNTILNLIREKVSGPRTSEIIDNLVLDTGIEHLLKSWLVLSNHDQQRLKNEIPDAQDRAFALALAIALPGSPSVYYGEEIGLSGGNDPYQRGPMDWDLVAKGTPETAFYKQLLAIRNSHRALQVGDFMRIPSEKLCAFTRYTASVRETMVVVANPTKEPVTEILTPRDSWLQDDSPMQELFSGQITKISAGYITVTVPPKTVQIYQPVIVEGPDYNRYKRVP